MAINLKALKSQKEQWYKALERYRKERQELNNSVEVDSRTKRFSPEDVRKMNIINNDMDICRLNIDIIDIKEQIKNLQEQNVKLKTNM
jgi:GTP-binding protein EngB required for normal cell division